MADWRYTLQSKRTKYFVLAFALVDGAGIYYAHTRLNQPWVPAPGAASEETFARFEPQPAAIPDERDVSPELARADLAPLLPPSQDMPRAVEFPPLPEQLEDTTAADTEAAAVAPSVKLALRAAAAAPKVARYLPARKSGVRFASAFATDISGSAATGSTLPEPAFGFAPAAHGGTEQALTASGAAPGPAVSGIASVDGASVSASDDYAVQSQAEAVTLAPASSESAEPQLQEPGGASPAELPPVDAEFQDAPSPS